MSKIFLKVFPSLIFWGLFAGVILTVPYPEGFTQARPDQLTFFFIPLFLALIFTLNIFLENILQSFSISLGIIFLLVLKALDSLNIVTGLLILISVWLLCSYFKKAKKEMSGIRGIRKK